jgi:NAD-dependent dihydropyrimidine dehydrogenase PreA subunit
MARAPYIALATLALDDARCTGCRACVAVCPHGVFEMGEDKRAHVVAIDRCMECGACALNCRFGALSVDAGVGCASGIIRGWLTGGESSCGGDGDGGACC